MGEGDLAFRNVLVLAFLTALLMQAGAGFLRSLAQVSLGARVHLGWLTDVFAHTLRLPASFFERRYASELMGRFEGVSHIQEAMTGGVIEVLLDGLMSVGVLLMMYVYNARLAAVTTGAIALVFGVRFAFLDRLRDSLPSYEALHARQQGYFLETVRSIQSVKLFCAEGMCLAKWANLAARCHRRRSRAESVQALFRLANSLVFGLDRLFAIWFATGLVTQRTISLGMLFSYITNRELLTNRVMNPLEKYVQARTVEIHLDRLSDIALAEPEQEGTRPILLAGGEPPRLEFSDLWFRYSDGDPWILKGASGVVKGYATIAITGPSGCGKSTLFRVLQGFLQPTKGAVKVNGVPIREAVNSYRRLIAAVSQAEDLIGGTIAENIAFFDAPVDLERVQLAGTQANIHLDVNALPMQYNTVMADGGASLSGGQKQRILLARALYKQPRILFLDEATSHLDVGTEQSILAVVKELPFTRLIVAHRPETIAACDAVFDLRDGVLHTVQAAKGAA